MNKHRKHYTPEQKAAILRRHLLEKKPTSKRRLHRIRRAIPSPADPEIWTHR
ncbi:MAG TPA: hypothetical protein VFN26_22635 [Candidatus Acidoferrum sp.]|nr:hypothetical protein [Candidatus Acidoferrum sp.]